MSARSSILVPPPQPPLAKESLPPRSSFSGRSKSAPRSRPVDIVPRVAFEYEGENKVKWSQELSMERSKEEYRNNLEERGYRILAWIATEDDTGQEKAYYVICLTARGFYVLVQLDKQIAVAEVWKKTLLTDSKMFGEIWRHRVANHEILGLAGIGNLHLCITNGDTVNCYQIENSEISKAKLKDVYHAPIFSIAKVLAESSVVESIALSVIAELRLNVQKQIDQEVNKVSAELAKNIECLNRSLATMRSNERQRKLVVDKWKKNNDANFFVHMETIIGTEQVRSLAYLEKLKMQLHEAERTAAALAEFLEKSGQELCRL